MIDWHSHILPGIDDGSGSIEESLALLKMQREQGADTVIATPHFFADDETVDEFLARRQQSLDSLLSAARDEIPRIICGAEVKYYPGIGKLESLSKLCIGESNLILLEMPMGKWTEYTVRELTEIAVTHRVRVILAHIDRYLKLESDSVWERLYESGILMQVNASFFNELFTKKKATDMLARGGIHAIGSDCHNLRNRPPRLGKAYELIRKKLGDEFVTQFNEYGYSLLFE